MPPALNFEMMRYFYFFPVLFLLFQSCNENFTFTSSQPRGARVISQFPAEMQGSFVNVEDDTLEISATSFVFDGGDMISLTGDITPEGVVLKKMGDWYFINLEDEGEWVVYPFKLPGKNRLTVYYSDMTAKELEIHDDLLQDVEVQKKYLDGKLDYYLLNPTKPQFKQLLKKGLFSEKMEFTRI